MKEIAYSKVSVQTRNHSENTLNEFFRMWEVDILVIFALISQDKLEIPNMALSDLKIMIFKCLKLNKACDVFKLMVEHF